MTYFKVLPGGRTVKRTVFVRLLNRQTANPTAFASKELLFNCMNDSDKSVLFEVVFLKCIQRFLFDDLLILGSCFEFRRR